ncbi:hypothetical protein H2198_006724 [Neophaeococcomyces mojaviensis]|uniref:Uncharacterized protein n=1 Tax=Neophaeococcomyces mojaviensis TaxID=3383035 RepID=A0ACC3A227_9EURO|nr:hypothetical protein H2198_006724 [Knufia sp. JES_112]
MTTLNDADLTIEINEERLSYYPGDQLQGHLQLRLTKDSPIGKVSVRLSGCTKWKIVQSNGQSTSTFRGRAELFSDERILHDDHYKHKCSVIKWPFEFRIPDVVNLSNVGTKWNRRDGFLTTDDKQAHPLPPSFKFADSRTGKRWHAFTAYVIEATVIEPEDRKILKPKTKRLVKAIRVLPRPTPESIDVNDPRQRRGSLETFTIRTLRLLPEHAKSLSIMQRTKSLSSPANLPRFTFDIDVSYPSIIQAYHPTVLPFVVAASARTDADLTTIQPDMRSFYRYPSLMVRHLKLSLQANTDCRCPSILSDTYAGTVHDITLVDRHFSHMPLMVRSLAWDQKNEREDDTPSFINFGKECNIVVTRDSRDHSKNGKMAKSTQESPPVQTFISPSFTTYNISRRYYLAWSVEFECAGEKVMLKGRSSEEVTVLGPAASESGDLLPDDALWNAVPGDDGGGDDEEVSRRPSNRDTLPAYSILPDSGTSTIESGPARSAGKGR